MHTRSAQDTLIYSAVCPRLGAGKRVAVKVYDKAKVQSTKYRAIKVKDSPQTKILVNTLGRCHKNTVCFQNVPSRTHLPISTGSARSP